MRIFDTFLFDGELALLEHRLAETSDLVDVIVMVEAGVTFQGQPKPMVLSENLERFAWLGDKLRHVALHDLGGEDRSAWSREGLQRNAIMMGLRDAEPDDVILIMDVDEILSRDTLQAIRAQPIDGPRRLGLTRHFEFADMAAPGSACCPDPRAPFPFSRGRMPAPQWSELAGPWLEYSPVAVRFRDLCGDEAGTPPRSAYDFRRLAHHAGPWPNAGRHFVCVDPASRPERKLARVSHVELSDRRGADPDHLRRARRHGVHHRGWWYAERPAGDLPDDIARLGHRTPAVLRDETLPPMPMRRLLRTWAWLRLTRALPDGLVRYVDRHYEALLPLLAPVLIVAGGLRRLSAARGWRWLKAASAPAPVHIHG